MAIFAADLRSIVNQDGAVVLNSKQNQITTLNAMGGYIWRLLEQGLVRDEIVQHLINKTQEQPETIGRDVDDFLSVLVSINLLLPSSVSASRSEER
jgi:hypothetical protein